MRRAYETVFVHMNKEYVLLGGIFWRLARKQIVFWYNHTAGGLLTRAAMALSHVVCHTSPFSFTAGSKKSRQMPVGIDTSFFAPDSRVPRSPHSGICLGRVAPLKKVEVMTEAFAEVLRDFPDAAFQVVGDAAEKDRAYFSALRRNAPHGVSFLPAAPQSEVPALYRRVEYAVNLTPRGNFDKAALEAVACGALLLTSSEAFAEIVPREFFCAADAASLASAMRRLFLMAREKKEALARDMRERVVRTHDISALARKLSEIFFETT